MINKLASDMAIKWCQHIEFCNEERQNSFAAAFLVKNVTSCGDGGHQVILKRTFPHSPLLKKIRAKKQKPP